MESVPQERVSERIVEQTVDAPVPQAMEGIVESDVSSALAVTCVALAAVIEYVEHVAPSPAAAHAVPAPGSEHVASTLTVYFGGNSSND